MTSYLVADEDVKISLVPDPDILETSPAFSISSNNLAARL
jgi:hypothetical protein